MVQKPEVENFSYSPIKTWMIKLATTTKKMQHYAVYKKTFKTLGHQKQKNGKRYTWEKLTKRLSIEKSDKIGFKAKDIIRDKEITTMIKRTISRMT